MGFPGGSAGKESACTVGDLGLIPGLGRSPGGGHGNPLQYSCLENPHAQSLAGYSPWDSPGQNTGVGSHSLSQGIFPTQGSNPGLPHCRWILYQLSPQGSPKCMGLGQKFSLTIRTGKHYLWPQSRSSAIYHGNFVSCSSFTLTVFRTLV